MRVTAALALLVAGAIPGVARAQVPQGAPAEPSTHVGAEALFDWLSADGVSGPSFGVAALGAWAPHPALELGAGLDVRGAHLSSGAQRGAGRFGLGLLRLWVGTGASSERLAGGARLVGLVGPRGVGLDGLDGGAPELGLSLRLDGTWTVHRLLALALTLEAGWLADGVTDPHGAAQLDVSFLDSRTRPFVGLAVLGARGASPALRPRAGVTIDLAPWSLAAELVFGLPGDPAGHVVGLTVTGVRSLGDVD